MAQISRRLFMAATPTALVGVANAQPAGEAPASTIDDLYPTTSAERASAFVGACHAQLDRVREMLAEDAGLACASWDWGFGDWESAIGAASHTGRVDIIELLIAHGARPTVFTLATLDRIDALRDLLSSVPSLESIEGPHSISLYRHAEAGKAERVLGFLQDRGVTDTNVFAIERADAEPYFGNYVFGPGETERFEVSWFERMSSISIKRHGGIARNLIPLGNGGFSPAGARHVRMRFETEGDTVARLIVPWAGRTIVASRV